LGLYCLGAFSLYKVYHPEETSLNWIPLASFSFVIYIASWGVFTLPFLVLSEILPEKIRGFSTTLCMTLFWIFATLVMKYLSILLEVWGMHGTMMLFATNSLVGAIFLLILLPETKNKSFDEIKKLLEK
jgi:MFS family permease